MVSKMKTTHKELPRGGLGELVTLAYLEQQTALPSSGKNSVPAHARDYIADHARAVVAALADTTTQYPTLLAYMSAFHATFHSSGVDHATCIADVEHELGQSGQNGHSISDSSDEYLDTYSEQINALLQSYVTTRFPLVREYMTRHYPPLKVKAKKDILTRVAEFEQALTDGVPYGKNDREEEAFAKDNRRAIVDFLSSQPAQAFPLVHAYMNDHYIFRKKSDAPQVVAQLPPLPYGENSRPTLVYLDKMFSSDTPLHIGFTDYMDANERAINDMLAVSSLDLPALREHMFVRQRSFPDLPPVPWGELPNTLGSLNDKVVRSVASYGHPAEALNKYLRTYMYDILAMLQCCPVGVYAPLSTAMSAFVPPRKKGDTNPVQSLTWFEENTKYEMADMSWHVKDVIRDYHEEINAMLRETNPRRFPKLSKYMEVHFPVTDAGTLDVTISVEAGRRGPRLQPGGIVERRSADRRINKPTTEKGNTMNIEAVTKGSPQVTVGGLVSIRVETSANTEATLRAIAHTQGITVDSVVEQAMRLYLDKLANPQAVTMDQLMSVYNEHARARESIRRPVSQQEFAERLQRAALGFGYPSWKDFVNTVFENTAKDVRDAEEAAEESQFVA